MELIIYPLLSFKSRKAMTRSKKADYRSWGHPYHYEPSGNTLKRLANETGMTMTQVRDRFIEEREYLLTQQSNN